MKDKTKTTASENLHDRDGIAVGKNLDRSPNQKDRERRADQKALGFDRISETEGEEFRKAAARRQAIRASDQNVSEGPDDRSARGGF